MSPPEELLAAVAARAAALGQRPAPPLSADRVAAAEARLGFPLPPLLRAIYTRVGDGGVGPGRGLVPLLDPGPDGPTRGAVEMYLDAVRPTDGHPDLVWPAGMLAVCWWGGNVFGYADCTDPDPPVYRFEPPADWGWDVGGYHLRPLGVSLGQWLSSWAEGRDVEPAPGGNSADGRAS